MSGQTVTTSFGSSGLNSLRVNGTEYLAFGDLRVNGVSMKDPAGQTISANVNRTISVNTAGELIPASQGWVSSRLPTRVPATA